MSRLSRMKEAEGQGFAAGLKAIQQTMVEGGSRLATSNLTRGVISCESLSEEDAMLLARNLDELEVGLEQAMVEMGVDLKEALPSQKMAMKIIAAAYADPLAYHQAATKPTTGLEGIAALTGLNGQYDYVETAISQEAFSEQELRNNMALSIGVNFMAARQNAFGEAFYPTQVMTPDQAAAALTMSIINLHGKVRQNVNGNQVDFGWKNLVEAQRDASILNDDSTALIPIYDSTDANNAAKFMGSPYITGHTTKTIEGYDIKTRPLKPGVSMSLLGLSQHPGLIASGILDETDAIDAAVKLDAIYIAVAGTNGSAFTDVFQLKTGMLPRCEFQKSVEGNYREVALQFASQTLFLDKAKLEIDASANEAFTGLADSDKVQLKVSVSGTLNLETGALEVIVGTPTIVKIFGSDGTEISQASGVGQTIAGYTYSVVGYDLAARRSNANRRTQGMLAAPTEFTERYVVPLSSPITCKSPLGTNRDARDLEVLVNVARVRNSINAVTNMLNYADTLKAFTAAAATGVVAEVQGIARKLVKPTYVEANLDLETTVNSISSGEKINDIQGALTAKLRDVVQRLVRDSGYLQGLDILTAGQNCDYEVVIGTDQVLDQYIMTAGDTRTLGNGKDVVVVTTPDSRFDGKIAVSLRRKGVQGFDPMTFGTMLYIPELASSIQNTRNGSTHKEASVQLRTLHVPVLPILGMITVTGLSEVLSDKVAIDFLDVTP